MAAKRLDADSEPPSEGCDPKCSGKRTAARSQGNREEECSFPTLQAFVLMIPCSPNNHRKSTLWQWRLAGAGSGHRRMSLKRRRELPVGCGVRFHPRPASVPSPPASVRMPRPWSRVLCARDVGLKRALPDLPFSRSTPCLRPITNLGRHAILRHWESSRGKIRPDSLDWKFPFWNYQQWDGHVTRPTRLHSRTTKVASF